MGIDGPMYLILLSLCPDCIRCRQGGPAGRGPRRWDDHSSLTCEQSWRAKKTRCLCALERRLHCSSHVTWLGLDLLNIMAPLLPITLGRPAWSRTECSPCCLLVCCLSPQVFVDVCQQAALPGALQVLLCSLPRVAALAFLGALCVSAHLALVTKAVFQASC